MVYFAGRLSRWQKELFDAIILEEGATLAATLDDNVALVILGYGVGGATAEKKARALQAKGSRLRILSRLEFAELMLPPKEQLAAWFRHGVEPWNRRMKICDFDQLSPLHDLDLRGADLRDWRLWGNTERSEPGLARHGFVRCWWALPGEV